MEENTKIALFRGKKIRKVIFKNEWWFSVVDVVEALTDSPEPRDYWYRMKVRVKSEDGIELSTICRQLKLEASDGELFLEKEFFKEIGEIIFFIHKDGI